MISPAPGVRLFESELFERLSRVHPLAPLLVWTPIIAWLLWDTFAVRRMQAGPVAALAAAGLVAWSLTEYLIHRFVFHLRPRSEPWRRLVFIVHGVHHEAPDDRTRLVMPPAPALIAAAALFALFRVALGDSAAPFFAFFLLGYLAYDYTHFAVHAGRPRTRLGRFLRRWHMQHHFATPDARWGVSSPLWDHVFRTTGTRV